MKPAPQTTSSGPTHGKKHLVRSSAPAKSMSDSIVVSQSGPTPGKKELVRGSAPLAVVMTPCPLGLCEGSFGVSGIHCINKRLLERSASGIVQWKDSRAVKAELDAVAPLVAVERNERIVPAKVVPRKVAMTKRVGKKVAKLAGVRLNENEMRKLTKQVGSLMKERSYKRTQDRKMDRQAKQVFNSLGGLLGLPDTEALAATFAAQVDKLRTGITSAGVKVESAIDVLTTSIKDVSAMLVGKLEDSKKALLWLLAVLGAAFILWKFGPEVYAKFEAIINLLLEHVVGVSFGLGMLTLWYAYKDTPMDDILEEFACAANPSRGSSAAMPAFGGTPVQKQISALEAYKKYCDERNVRMRNSRRYSTVRVSDYVDDAVEGPGPSVFNAGESKLDGWRPFANGIATFLGTTADIVLPKLVEFSVAGAKVMKGVSFFTWLWNIIQRVFGWFIDSHSHIRDVINNGPLKADVSDWMARVGEISTNGTLTRITMSRTLARDIAELSQEGHKLAARLARIGDSEMARAVSSSFRLSFLAANTLNEAAQRTLCSNESRPEPVTFLLLGKPGIGKSMLSNHITLDLLNHIRPSVKHVTSEHIYARNIADDFISGYHGQPGYILDDVFQIRDLKRNRKYIDEVVNGVNSVPYRLNMAALEEKGSTLFTSEVMCFSTNGTEMSIDGVLAPIMTDSGAFWRRIHFSIEPLIKKQYRKGGVKEMLDLDLANTADHPTDVYTFRVVRRRGVSSDGPVFVNYAELRSMMLDQYADLHLAYQRKMEKAPATHAPLRAIKMHVVRRMLMCDSDHIHDDDDVPYHEEYDVWKYHMKMARLHPYPEDHELIANMMSRENDGSVEKWYQKLLVAFLAQMNGCYFYGRSLVRSVFEKAVIHPVNMSIGRYMSEAIPHACQVAVQTWEAVKPELHKFALIAAAMPLIGLAISLVGPTVNSVFSGVVTEVKRFFLLEQARRSRYCGEVGKCTPEGCLVMAFYENDEAFVKLMNEDASEHQCECGPETLAEFADDYEDWRLTDPEGFDNLRKVVFNSATQREVKVENRREHHRRPGFKTGGRPEARTPRSYLAHAEVVKSDLNLTKITKTEAAVCNIRLIYTFIQDGVKFTRDVVTKGLVSGQKVYTVRHLFNPVIGKCGVVDSVTARTTRGDLVLDVDRTKYVTGVDVVLIPFVGEAWPDLDGHFVSDEELRALVVAGRTFVSVVPKLLGDKVVPTSTEFHGLRSSVSPYSGLDELYIHGYGTACRGASGAPLLADTARGLLILGFLSMSDNETFVPRSRVYSTYSTVTNQELALAQPYDYKRASVIEADPSAGRHSSGEFNAVLHPRGEENAARWGAFYPVSQPKPIPIGLNVYRVCKTSLIKSGLVPMPNIFPAELQGPTGDRDKYFIEPAIKMSKHCTIDTSDPDWLWAKNDVVDELASVLSNQHLQISTRTALWGSPFDDNLKGMDMKTSAGFPFRTEGFVGPRTKLELFGANSTADFHPMMDDIFDTLIEDVLSGTKCVWRYPFIDTLKDELRPAGKAPRLFQVGCVHMNVLARMFYGNFVRDVIAHHRMSSIKVGINPYNHEYWGALAGWLDMFPGDETPFYIAGDFSGFDKMLSEQVLDSVFDIMDEVSEMRAPRDEAYHRYERLDSLWQTPQLARRFIRDWIVRSHHINQGFSYVAAGGNPSGNALTTIVNSVAQLVIMRYAMIKLTGSPVANIAIYGDDSVIKTPDHKKVTQHTLTAFLASVGIVFTNAEKDYDVMHTPPLLRQSQVEFLKRSFIYTDRWWAPLRRDTIENMVGWVDKRNRGDMGVLNSIVSQSLREAVAWGRDYYNQWHFDMRKNVQWGCEIDPDIDYWSLDFMSFERASREWKYYGQVEDFYLVI